MEMGEDCLASAYSNNVLLFIILSYKLCNSVLPIMVMVSYGLYVIK